MKRLFIDLLATIVAAFIALGIIAAVLTWWAVSR